MVLRVAAWNINGFMAALYPELVVVRSAWGEATCHITKSRLLVAQIRGKSSSYAVTQPSIRYLIIRSPARRSSTKKATSSLRPRTLAF